MFHNCFHVLLQNNDITLLAVSNAWCQRKTSSDYTEYNYNNSMIVKTEALAPMGQRKFLNFTALEWLKHTFFQRIETLLSHFCLNPTESMFSICARERKKIVQA